MSTKKLSKDGKIMRYIKGPVKLLARARDFYVRSLSDCAGQAAFNNAIGYPGPQFMSLPKSFSVNSSYSDHISRDEDLRELIRVASTRSLTGKVEAELLRSKRSPPMSGGVVAIGRIDEDKPCEFGDVEVYPRSRSCANFEK